MINSVHKLDTKDSTSSSKKFYKILYHFVTAFITFRKKQ